MLFVHLPLSGIFYVSSSPLRFITKAKFLFILLNDLFGWSSHFVLVGFLYAFGHYLVEVGKIIFEVLVQVGYLEVDCIRT